MPLSASFGLSASGLLTKPLDLSIPVDSVIAGNGNFPAASFDLTDGNGDSQAQMWYHDLQTINAGSVDGWPLTGSLLTPLGGFANFLTIRAVLVVIKDPAPTKKLRIGPQGQADAAQLGFGGVGAEAYVEFDRHILLAKTYGGWMVTSPTAYLLYLKNTGSVALDYAWWILGTTS
jgi:hypothetical protein